MIADNKDKEKDSYERLGEVVITKGDGLFIYDEHGNKYLDVASGVGVVNIGHSVKNYFPSALESTKTRKY